MSNAPHFLPQEIIRHKRDAKQLTREEIDRFIAGVVDDSVSDAQIAAFAMATFLVGLSDQEVGALTAAMARSGTVIDWSQIDLNGPIIDKHSTGGVGDKVSFLLAPILAACGGYVPMLSGRGLGHTGGTLDKLEAIPGYQTQPSIPQLQAVVQQVGCAIVGQTDDLAPADRRIYAVRDATGSVESISLIVCSILAKKLAAGLDALIFDVKVGSGAFMTDLSDATELAEKLVTVASYNDLRSDALLTSMDEVLGRTAGNAVEVIESLECLTGQAADQQLLTVTLELAARLLALAKIVNSHEEGYELAQTKLDSGEAAEKFGQMVSALGGPNDLLENGRNQLSVAPESVAVVPVTPGYVNQIDVRSVGLAIIELGGGRRREDEQIDHGVGLTEIAKVGEWVDREHPLAVVHARSQADAQQVAQRLHAAFTLDELQPDPPILLRPFAPAGVKT